MDNELDFGGKQTSSVKVMKMSKGYNWEIKIYNEDIDVILEQTKVIDDKLKERYGNQEEKR